MTDVRFAKRVRIDPDGCHTWTGATRNGYGVVRVDGRLVGVHRYACGAQLAPGMQVRNTCGNKCCVNPEHLVARYP